MNILITIFFILMVITIVIYAFLLKKQADQDEYMRANRKDSASERRSHSAL